MLFLNVLLLEQDRRVTIFRAIVRLSARRKRRDTILFVCGVSNQVGNTKRHYYAVKEISVVDLVLILTVETRNEAEVMVHSAQRHFVLLTTNLKKIDVCFVA